MLTRTRSRRTPRDSASPSSGWRLSTAPLVVVAGKGGVGRSTVAAALGVAAARRGLRTAVVEISGNHDRASVAAPDVGAAMRAATACPDLEHLTVDRHAALADYLRTELPIGMPARIFARNRMFEVFVDAAPGLGELLTIGEVCNLARPRGRRHGNRPYDLVVLDGPASGHFLGLLTAPRTFASIARVGPVATQATAIDRMLRDPAFLAVVAVTTPEQMAVTETLALRSSLATELGIEFAAVAVNKLFPARFGRHDEATLLTAPDDPAVRTALWYCARARAQAAQLRRLRKGLGGVPSLTLPFMFAEAVDRDAIDKLAGALDRWLR